MKKKVLLSITLLSFLFTYAQEKPWPGPSVRLDHGKLKVSDNQRYIVHYTVFTGVPDESAPLVQVYPNPATSELFINGVKDARIDLIGLDGKQVKGAEGFSGGSIDISGLNNGIYILRITTHEGDVLRKKIVVQ